MKIPSIHQNKNRHYGNHGFIRYLILSISGIFTVYPIYWLITTALKTRVEFFQNIFGLPHQINFENILRVLEDQSLLKFYANSTLITVTTIILVLTVGTMAGYVLARFEFKGRDIIFFIFLLTQLIPLTVIVIPLYTSLATLNLLGERAYLGLIGSMVALNLGISILFTRGFFRTLSKELLEAARLDGCEELQVFWYIALPLARGGLIVLCIIVFINTWNEYFLSLIIIPDIPKYTLPLGLIYYQGQFQTLYPQLASAIFLATIPTIILYSFFQEQVIKGIGAGTGAMKG